MVQAKELIGDFDWTNKNCVFYSNEHVKSGHQNLWVDQLHQNR